MLRVRETPTKGSWYRPYSITGLLVSQLCDPTSENLFQQELRLHFKGVNGPNLARSGHAQNLRNRSLSRVSQSFGHGTSS
jgi:hypothetical protein